VIIDMGGGSLVGTSGGEIEAVVMVLSSPFGCSDSRIMTYVGCQEIRSRSGMHAI
jgi:hypothetical protein